MSSKDFRLGIELHADFKELGSYHRAHLYGVGVGIQRMGEREMGNHSHILCTLFESCTHICSILSAGLL